MAMFERVTEHVVASAGPKTLHTVADINSAERYKTLSVVERKRSFWFWKNPSMIPTFVTLNDLLGSSEDIAAKEIQFTLLKKYEDKPGLNVSGSVQVAASLAKKIAAQADIKLDGEDKMELVINLGDITKCEIPFEDLREAMKDNHIDVTHPLYVSAAKNSPKTSLCVVIEDLATKDDGSVKGDGEWKISTDANAAGPNCIHINVKGSAAVESTCTRSYTIPPGTVLAYGCVEMSVDPNGVVQLHDIEDTLDESFASLQLPENPFDRIKNELGPLTNSHNIYKLQHEVKALLANASETDFRVMHILLYYANADASMPVSTLKHLLGVDITLKWKQFMSLFGFSIQEDVVMFPTKIDDGLRKACLAIIDSILDCHQNSWKDLPNISHDHARILMKVIENQFENKDISLDDADLSYMIKRDPLAMTFLEKCDFRKSLGNMLTFTGKNSYELLDVYAIMYFLCSGQRHCSIL